VAITEEVPTGAPEAVEPEETGAGPSLAERVAARRRELARERTAVLAIPGYEDMLAARYRMLDFHTLRKIAERNRGQDEADEEIANAADTLIHACVEILEVDTGDDGERVYRSTGQRWTAKAARELFGAELPNEATARDALLAAIPGAAGEGDGLNVMVHFAAYDRELSRGNKALAQMIQGESEPSPEG
jgi:hypothetical protein